MAILTIVDILFTNFGIIQTLNANFWEILLQKFRIIIVLCSISFLLIPAAASLMLKVENMEEVTDVLYTIFGFGIVLSAYISFVYQQLKVRKTLTDLGNAVEKSW